MLHFCGEIRLNHWYRRAAQMAHRARDPQIYDFISRDEARHGGAYLQFMRRAIERTATTRARAFAKIGVLMASARRAGKAAAPTNLHVNRGTFSARHVQSRLPGPRLARALARFADRVRPRVRDARHRPEIAQPVIAVGRTFATVRT
jgi:hypothetical protein